MHWHTLNNIPGYLSTTAAPLPHFESWEDARRSLLEDLQDLISADSPGDVLKVCLQLEQLVPWFDNDVTVYAAGRAWQILGCQETNCGTEET